MDSPFGPALRDSGPYLKGADSSQTDIETHSQYHLTAQGWPILWSKSIHPGANGAKATSDYSSSDSHHNFVS
jgi:hypothetical protein